MARMASTWARTALFPVAFSAAGFGLSLRTLVEPIEDELQLVDQASAFLQKFIRLLDGPLLGRFFLGHPV
jgi:hypothetical protein